MKSLHNRFSVNKCYPPLLFLWAHFLRMRATSIFRIFRVSYPFNIGPGSYMAQNVH